ncbi:MAG: type II secretion system F family protein, partial [Candidatus Eremiobacteraeota bacterium]|nr:type II secretion system F family protein [Candidatus Eremiobacteraeota bacterium]
SLHEALERTGRFQPTFIGFVRIGERSGKVPEMLRKLSEYYADELDALLETVPATIQTVVTFALGALVGVLVYAVYVPLTALSSSVR